MYEQFFRGYVRTANKVCSTKFKGVPDDELLTLEQAQKCAEYAGILDENAVVIDIDDETQSNILLDIVVAYNVNCRVYKTTRGMHFLFRNDGKIDRSGTHKKLACGLTADIKAGIRNSYIVRKFKGKERPVFYDIEPDEEYQSVPDWLLPITGKVPDFLDMAAGDGRNDALFKYILKLQSNGHSKDSIKTTLEIMNNYILSDPLPEKELEVITRDGAFQKPAFYDGKTFLHAEFAAFLVSEYYIVKLNGKICSYQGGVYRPVNLDRLIIKHLPHLKQTQRSEVKSYLSASLDETSNVADARYIAFKNGILDVVTGSMNEFDPALIIPNMIPWDYDPEAESEIGEQFLWDVSCDREDVFQLLTETIGYTFFRRNELRKAILLLSEHPGSGKSTFIDALIYTLGAENVSALDLRDLSHEFKAVGISGKLANVGDDIESEYIPDPGTFKKVVSGSRINANVKYGEPVEFNPYCKLIFSGNDIPRLGRGNDAEAIRSRLIVVPFGAEFSPDLDGFDPFISTRLKTPEVAEYFIRLGVEGLNDVLRNNRFSETADGKKRIDEYTRELDPVMDYLDERGERMAGEPTAKEYRFYCDYCISNGYRPISQISFTKRAKARLNLDNALLWDAKEGKQYRVFIRKGMKK